MKDAIFTPTEDPMITTGEDVDRETLENEEREEREDSPQGQSMEHEAKRRRTLGI
jgi:hypothetical protein